MALDRWDLIKNIFSEAADLPKQERSAFLERACAGDPDLRAQVDGLLEHIEDTQSMDFFATVPLWTLQPGDVLGDRFRIIRFVGKGGMGEVYEAEDQELSGRLALKVLLPELSDAPDFLSRFRREVQLGRQVTHANVCRVYDVGYDRHGNAQRAFLTMEFLDGETLAQRLPGAGPLDPGTALPLIRQMAAGLAALHEQGIVHRDFKPGNVLVVRSNSGAERAVITDFGLARALEPSAGATLTRASHVIGTPDFMAPEQLLGEPVTPATDVYAFGLVMYQMVTGKKAFPGGRQIENAVQRIVETPVPPSRHSKTLEPRWNDVILSCLARRPEDRPSASDIPAALEGSLPPKRSRRGRLARWVLAGSAFALILAAIVLGLRLEKWTATRSAPSNASQNLALLPFKVATDDAALRVFAEGLTEMITSRMSQFEQGKIPLLVVPASEVRSQGARTAGEARQKFHVSAAVEGTLEGRGDRIRLLLTLIDTGAMRQLDTITVDEQRTASWRLQDAAVTRLANSLNLHLQARYAQEQQAMSPLEPGAYDFYLQARGYLQRNDQAQSVASAVTLLQRAIALDPKFALAHSALGKAYFYQFLDTRDPRKMDAALASGTYAVKLNPDLPETNIALGLILHGTARYAEALRHFEKAIDLDARNHEAYQGLAKAYLGLRDYPKAEATYVKAISLRPDDWTGYKALALYYYEREDYTKAAEQFRKVVELTPDNAQGYLNLGAAQAGREDWDSAEKAWSRALELDPRNAAALSNLGKIYLDQRHQTAQAIDMYQRAIALNGRSYRSWGQLGRAYARSGDKQKAGQSFGKAAELIGAELLVNPKGANLYSSLAFYRALMGRKDFEAPARRALELMPESGEILERAAECYAIAGNRPRARELLDQALARGVPMKSVQRSEYLKDLTPSVTAGNRK